MIHTHRDNGITSVLPSPRGSYAHNLGLMYSFFKAGELPGSTLIRQYMLVYENCQPVTFIPAIPG